MQLGRPSRCGGRPHPLLPLLPGMAAMAKTLPLPFVIAARRQPGNAGFLHIGTCA